MPEKMPQKRLDICHVAWEDVPKKTADKILPQKMPRYNEWQAPTGDGGVHSKQPQTGGDKMTKQYTNISNKIFQNNQSQINVVL